jgi:hypothetical protein
MDIPGKTEKQIYTINNSPNGKGLYASRDISEGTILLKISGRFIDFDAAVKLDEKEGYCLQVDLNTYIVPHFPFFLSNHSCAPNCGINCKMEFITISDIKKGTELVWDYSTSMLERHWTMECNCNQVNCRKIVEDFDLLPPHVQQYYLEKKIVMPYIKRFDDVFNKITGKHLLQDNLIQTKI